MARKTWLRVALIIVLGMMIGLVGCGGETTSSDDYTIQMTAANMFSPRQIVVNSGDSVKWINTSLDPHTVKADPANAVAGGPDSSTQYPLPAGIATGQSYRWKVPDVPSGTRFYYHCELHGQPGNGSSLGTGMAGVVLVQ